MATLAVFGIKGYCGDAPRPEVLVAARIETAKVLVEGIDNQDKAEAITRYPRAERPPLR